MSEKFGQLVPSYTPYDGGESTSIAPPSALQTNFVAIFVFVLTINNMLSFRDSVYHEVYFLVIDIERVTCNSRHRVSSGYLGVTLTLFSSVTV